MANARDLSLRDTDNELRLRFFNDEGDTGIDAARVGRVLVALQEMFDRIARGRSDLLGELRDLPPDERVRIFTLQIVDARMGSLELLIGPNVHYAHASLLQHSEHVNVAFRAISSTLVTYVNQVKEGTVAGEIPGPFATTLRKLARAFKPDKLALKLSIGIVSCQLDYDFAQRLEAYEAAKKQESQEYRALEGGFETTDRISAVPRLNGPQISMADPVSGRSGPYDGTVLSIDHTNKNLSLQCEDYTAPIECQYDANMSMIAARLVGGEEIAIWGYPMRELDTRSDKPPVKIIHIDISLHPGP